MDKKGRETYERTSSGSPYFEYTSAFACVYPYGPDLYLLHTMEPPNFSVCANGLDSVRIELLQARKARGADIEAFKGPFTASEKIGEA